MPQTFAWDAVDRAENKLLAYAFAAVYTIAPVFLLYNLLGRPSTGADDANIFFVYARNFVHGHGIVYSIGGPHVEGYSSVLYFLLCCICYAITAQPEGLLLVLDALMLAIVSVLMLRAINVASAALNVPAATRLLLMTAMVGWLCVNPCYFAWNAVSLMDSGMYALVLAWAFSTFVELAARGTIYREKLQLSLLLIALVLVRPEGTIWAVCCLAAYFMLEPARLRTHWQPLAAFAGTALALLIFRELYFGYPLPNTYYAKMSASHAQTLDDGWRYLSSFFDLYRAAAILPLLAVAAMLAYGILQRNRIALIAACFGGISLALPALEGGDHFYAFRMYQPAWPLLGFCLLLPLMLLPQLRVLPKAAACLAIMALAILATDDASWTSFLATNKPGGQIADIRLFMLAEFNIAANERLNGEMLSEIFTPSLPTVGFGSAGGIAYGYSGRVYDMMGLNTPEMAHADAIKFGPKGHQSFNKVVFYKLAPDVLMPRAVPADAPVSLDQVAGYYTNPGGWDNLIFKNIFNDAEFRSKYTLVLLASNTQPAYKCYGYFNRSFIAQAMASGQYRVLATWP